MPPVWTQPDPTPTPSPFIPRNPNLACVCPRQWGQISRLTFASSPLLSLLPFPVRPHPRRPEVNSSYQCHQCESVVSLFPACVAGPRRARGSPERAVFACWGESPVLACWGGWASFAVNDSLFVFCVARAQLKLAQFSPRRKHETVHRSSSWGGRIRPQRFADWPRKISALSPINGCPVSRSIGMWPPRKESVHRQKIKTGLARDAGDAQDGGRWSSSSPTD
jgi:hypothetical protein